MIWEKICWVRNLYEDYNKVHVKRKREKLKKKLARIDKKEKHEEVTEENGIVFKEKYIKRKAHVAIILGILLLIITFLLSYNLNANEYSAIVEEILSSVILVLNTVISMVIGLGIGSLVLDFFEYIDYTRERIKEIMIDQKYIHMLSDIEKKKLINELEKNLYFNNGTTIDNSLYSSIKRKITPLITDDYFENYSVRVDCEINEENNTIKKIIHKKLEVICAKDDTDFQIPFSKYLTSITDIDNDKQYKINACTCNGNDCLSSILTKVSLEEIEKQKQENLEEIKFTIDYNFKLSQGYNYIELETETIVPIADTVYTHKITIPCKKYEMNFNVKHIKYQATAYGFMIQDKIKSNRKTLEQRKIENGYEIKFNDWMLPGEGCVVIINKKL